MSKRSYPGVKGRRKSAPFSAFPNELLDSPAYRLLKPHAAKLLTAITRGFNGSNNGSLIMPFEVARAWGFSNERTYTAALAQLVDRGFLEMTRSAVRRGRPMAARWAITWKPIDEPVSDHPHFAMPTDRPSNDWQKWSQSQSAKLPGKKRKATGKSERPRAAEMPDKEFRSSSLTGKRASQKTVFGDMRQANMPADLISTRDVAQADDVVKSVQLLPGELCVRRVLS